MGGEAVSVGEHFVKRTLRHDLPAVDARAGAHVHDVIGGADRILVMLHDDDGVAEVAEALQGDEQAIIVALVQADAGLVEDVEDARQAAADLARSEEHTSELQSLMRISYAVLCLKKK